MSAYIKKLTDNTDNKDTVYPESKTTAIYTAEGNLLSDELDGKVNISDIYSNEEIRNILTVDEEELI